MTKSPKGPDEKPDIALFQMIMDDFSEYMGMQTSYIERYKQYSYPQRVARLSDELRVHTLRELGNIQRFLDIYQKIADTWPDQIGSKDRKVFEIIEWVSAQMEALSPATDESDVLVISLASWGEAYIQKMLDFNFKTLLAYENMPCLSIEKRVVIYIQTSEAGQYYIENACIVKSLKALGIHFAYALIPDSILEGINGDELTYWMLAACGTLGLDYAKSLKATFHHSYPDAVYSRKFFSELLRLSKTHKAILGPGMRSDESLMIPLLTTYLEGERLSVSSPELIAHHLNSLHAVAWPFVVNNRPRPWFYPQSHVMIWESEECIYFNCPHLNAWWIDYSLLKDLPRRFYQTLDSELDLICEGENYYIPTEEDSLYQAELSPPNRQALVDAFCEASLAAQTLWGAISHRDSAKFFFRGMRTRIDRKIRPLPVNALRRQEIETHQRHLFNTMLASDPYALVKLKRKRTHLNYIFQ